MDEMDEKSEDYKDGLWLGFILGAFACALFTEIVMYIKEVI